MHIKKKKPFVYLSGRNLKRNLYKTTPPFVIVVDLTRNQYKFTFKVYIYTYIQFVFKTLS